MYPEYADVNGKRYKINTDYRVAIKCNKIAEDENIRDYERALAIIYTLFGEEGINNPQDYETLLDKAKIYLLCGEEPNDNKEDKDMDFEQDMKYIRASFRSDYGIVLGKEKMHWWEFYELLNGLSNSEMGNCCVLNRIRNIRTMDTKDITDKKLLQDIMEQKKRFALNKKKPTQEQLDSAKKFLEQVKGVI